MQNAPVSITRKNPRDWNARGNGMKPPPCFQDSESKGEIQRLCKENDVDLILLKDLCEIVGQHAGSGRKEGVVAEITECIDRFLDRS